MKISLKDKISDKLVKAFLKNKIVAPIPSKFTKKLTEANKFRKLCESKISMPIIGYKAGGTGIPVMKKLKEKEPFYASIFKNNLVDYPTPHKFKLFMDFWVFSGNLSCCSNTYRYFFSNALYHTY